MSQSEKPRQAPADASQRQPEPRGDAEHRYADRLEEEPAVTEALPGAGTIVPTKQPPEDEVLGQPVESDKPSD